MDIHLVRPWYVPGTLVPIDPPIGQLPQLNITDALAVDERVIYERRYGSIRSYIRESNNGRLSLYNCRLPVSGSIETVHEYMRCVFNRQATAFKCNAAIGAILKHKVTGRIRYFHPSANNYKLLDEPVTVRSWDDLQPLRNMTGISEWTDHAAMQMPDSAWKVVMVTNVTFYVYHMHQHPIGGKTYLNQMADDDSDDERDDDLDNDDMRPPSSKKRKTHHQKRRIAGVYTVPADLTNLCVFHCLAMDMEVLNSGGPPDPSKSRRKIAKELFHKWWINISPGKKDKNFQGVFMSDLNDVESFFDVGINVYTLENEDITIATNQRAILVRRPQTKYTRVINVHMSCEAHFDFIWSMNDYAKSFVCVNCGQHWKSAFICRRHQETCSRASTYKYKGGPYQPRKAFYDLLEEIGIWIDPKDRFYEYRATYDFESCLQQTSTSNVYTSRHIPMSVSVASNVPGFQGPYCIVSNGDSHQLVSDMIKLLLTISDQAYDLTHARMKNYLDKIEDLRQRQDKEPQDSQPKNKHTITPLQRAANRLESWMRAMPVVSFNGGRYDLQLIKSDLADIYAVSDPTHAMKPNTSASALEERIIPELGDCLAYVIKKGNSITCLATRKLTFLDVCNYIPPGYNYNKYLETYGLKQDGVKSYFPYEYVTSLDKLSENQLPSYESFYSSLRKANTLEDGKDEFHGRQQYEQLKQLWEQEGMTSLKDLLIYYNNADVVPFLKALDRQIMIYRDNDLDMLKDAPSLPGLGLKYGMKGLHGKFHTFGNGEAKLAHLVYDSLVGGPSIVFCRYAEAGITPIRSPDYGDQALTCNSLFGYDANSLYPWAMAQDLPVGPCVTRREPDYRIATSGEEGKKYSDVSLEWIQYESHLRGNVRIQHGGNGPEVCVGTKHIPVDGFLNESNTVFQFHGCVFHGHTCLDPTDPAASWLKISLQERRQRTQRVHQYLQDTCGYHVITMWECEWNELKKNDPAVIEFMKTCPSQRSSSKQALPDPGSDMESILQAIRDDRLFGMAVVDIHTPENLKGKFRDLPPIFKCAKVGRSDIGDHMRSYCEDTGQLSTPREMLISSYFAVETLIATPLLKWYMEMGLIITRVYMVMQYRKEKCLRHVTEDAADKRRIADLDPSQKLAGESAKLLVNSIYGKCCERKSRFREISFLSGPAASAAVCSNRFRDMVRLDTCGDVPPPEMASDHDIDPDTMPTLRDYHNVDDEQYLSKDKDVYEVSMAPSSIQMDLPVQIAFFVYAYAKMCMLQFRYELFEEYMDHRKWCPLYSDTDSYYVAMSGEDIHDIIKPDKKELFYWHYPLWFPSLACEKHMSVFVETMTNLSPTAWYPLRECCMKRFQYDQKTPGLFKTEYTGKGMIALASKTYICHGQMKDKFSCKGLQKNQNEDVLNFETYRKVLMTRQASGGINRGIKSTPNGHVYTYEQPRTSFSYLYAKRRVLDDGIHTEPLDL